MGSGDGSWADRRQGKSNSKGDDAIEEEEQEWASMTNEPALPLYVFVTKDASSCNLAATLTQLKRTDISLPAPALRRSPPLPEQEGALES